MKRLWKMIPPCYSDVLGFEAVLNETSGFGIVDDPSRYKPLKMDGFRNPHHPGGDAPRRPDGAVASEHTIAYGGPRNPGLHDRGDRAGETGAFHGQGAPDGQNGTGGYSGHGGHGGHGGPGGHGRPGLPEIRVTNSDIRNEDIIHGTQQKVLDTFDRSVAPRHPDFILLSYAPSSSMIGSDLDAAAEIIAQKSGLPAASVNVHGDKDYLYGVSLTLETMGKLLLTRQDTLPGTVNLLGLNSLDWSKETITATEQLLTDAGYTILSRWGAKETTENLKKAAAASVNLVVNAAGFRLARYMESEFGIPYLACAPFGADQSAALLDELKNGFPVPAAASQDKTAKDESACGISSPETSVCGTSSHEVSAYPISGGDEPEVLIIGEQLIAGAIRQALLHRNYQNVQVLSFYDMDKSILHPGDQKLSGEDDLVKKLALPSVRLIFGDPDCRALTSREIPWIDLPNGGSFSPAHPVPQFNMTGKALDQWLDQQLGQTLQNRSTL